MRFFSSAKWLLWKFLKDDTSGLGCIQMGGWGVVHFCLELSMRRRGRRRASLAKGDKQL